MQGTGTEHLSAPGGRGTDPDAQGEPESLAGEFALEADWGGGGYTVTVTRGSQEAHSTSRGRGGLDQQGEVCPQAPSEGKVSFSSWIPGAGPDHLATQSSQCTPGTRSKVKTKASMP